MYESIEFHIKGVTPTIMHNGQLANPMNQFAKEIKRFTSKRKKSDEDIAAIAKLEWQGSLYLDEQSRPCWPGECIERMLIDAAKKNKMGTQFKPAIVSDGNWPIIFKGPKDLEKLYADANFVDCRRAKVGTSSVMRTRPIFHDWELKFVVQFIPTLVDAAAVIDAVKLAGQVIGLSDWRPKYGRFTVLTHQHMKAAA